MGGFGGSSEYECGIMVPEGTSIRNYSIRLSK